MYRIRQGNLTVLHYVLIWKYENCSYTYCTATALFFFSCTRMAKFAMEGVGDLWRDSVSLSPSNRISKLGSTNKLRFGHLIWIQFVWYTLEGVLKESKSKSHYDRQSVGQSVLVSGTHLGPATNFSFSLKFSLDS
jgi:hypothetical protein